MTSSTLIFLLLVIGLPLALMFVRRGGAGGGCGMAHGGHRGHGGHQSHDRDEDERREAEQADNRSTFPGKPDEAKQSVPVAPRRGGQRWY
jgi:hypothetical protein